MIDVAYRGELKDPKTCLITLVNPGLGDQVLKVYPAEHSEEKIWLDTAPGIQRWEAIQRLMDTSVPRGQLIPKPAKWHSDPKQLSRPDLEEKNIPVIKMDGSVLKAPPKEEMPVFVQPKSQEDMQKQINDLSGNLSALATGLSNLTNLVTGFVTGKTEPKKVGRPKKLAEV